MFIKYPSIKCMKQALNLRDVYNASEEEWVWSEKIHGANFQIILEGGEVSFASRNRLLDAEAEDFFDFSHLREGLELGIRALAEDLGVSVLHVYGELYGGNIQTEILYGADHKFRVFDVLMNGKEWLPYRSFGPVEDHFDIVPMEFGILTDLVGRSVEFNSQFTDAMAEGYVIKRVGKSGLLTLKNKAADFVEKHTGKIIENKTYCVKHRPTAEEECPGIAGYVLNKNRIAAWFSKEGPKKEENIKRDARAIIEDAVKDYMEDNPTLEVQCVKPAAFRLFYDLVNMLE